LRVPRVEGLVRTFDRVDNRWFPPGPSRAESLVAAMTLDLSTQRVVVTGGAGFLGHAVLERLAARGVRDPFVPRRRDYDLTREADAARLYQDLRPEVVIHLAAEVGGIGANRTNPGRYFFANMAMALHLIEQARIHGIRKFVQVGTICAYPKFAPVPFREEDLWNGIPALIRKCETARVEGRGHIECWGTGSASREFLYVDDAAEGIVRAAETMEDPEPINLGTNMEISIRDLVELIARLVGFEGEIRWDPTKPDGQPRRCLDVTRARERLGWQAQVPFEEGLRRTIEWWRSGGRDR
jgi:GDP-L-fucose synthase